MAGSKGFRQMLAERQESINSLVCVGLDPVPEKLPACCLSGNSAMLAADVATWAVEIVDATASSASMYKPQRAHFEAIPNGAFALQTVIRHIKRKHPKIPVFLDCKRGDIGRTQQRYRTAHFEIDGADGMNFSPYMGEDCLKHLVDKDNLGRALVGLCYTSNPKARLTQDFLGQNGQPYWEFMAECILGWAEQHGVVENAGLVMAAAYELIKESGEIYSKHLSRCREIVGDKLWFLIPGIGTQGGFVAETVLASYFGWGTIAINSSSGIIFASSDDDYAPAAGRKAKALRDMIRKAMAAMAA